MGDNMNDKELINVLIDKVADLQRIKSAPDKDAEINKQLKLIKAKLEAMGVITTDLEF